MTTTILTDEQVVTLACQIDAQPEITMMRQFARAIEQAVLQSEQVQELCRLLREARQQLPLAAQFWNEDDEPERGSRNVARVMDLISRIDAAMERKT